MEFFFFFTSKRNSLISEKGIQRLKGSLHTDIRHPRIKPKGRQDANPKHCRKRKPQHPQKQINQTKLKPKEKAKPQEKQKPKTVKTSDLKIHRETAISLKIIIFLHDINILYVIKSIDSFRYISLLHFHKFL